LYGKPALVEELPVRLEERRMRRCPTGLVEEDTDEKVV
jgi:hypothetical protein